MRLLLRFAHRKDRINQLIIKELVFPEESGIHINISKWIPTYVRKTIKKAPKLMSALN